MLIRGAVAGVISCVVLLSQIALGVTGASQGGGSAATAGPQVGTRVPSFTGLDQFGNTHTLESALGAKGLMLVFFRSADW